MAWQRGMTYIELHYKNEKISRLSIHDLCEHTRSWYSVFGCGGEYVLHIEYFYEIIVL